MLAADVLITEFLASNDTGIVDGNGFSSDWIEVYNAGDESQNLAGWHLTDDSSDSSKWTFPDITESVIDPGEYLVVFASGDGVADPDGNLHTNFKLSAAGEYLALTRPDLSVVSEYGANGADYPSQLTDVSYGIAGVSGATEWIQYFDADEIPGGNTAGLPGGWVPRGAGAGDGSTNFANEGGALQANGSVSELATTISGLDDNQTYEVFAFFWDAGTAGWNIEAGLTSGALTNYTRSSQGVFQINASSQDPDGDRFVTGLNVLGQGSDDFSDYTDGNRQLYAVKVGEVGSLSEATLYVDHDSASSQRGWYDGVGLKAKSVLVEAATNVDYLIPANGNLGTTWTNNGFNASANGFSSGQAAIGYENNTTGNDQSYLPEILTQVPSGTTSVYLRAQFELSDAAAVSDLTLNMKYDDGFVAYLNGTRVASNLAPSNPVYNSTATGSHPDALALQYEAFSLTAFRSLLVDGQNTLAIHALNLSNSSDFLMSPRLSFASGDLSAGDIKYFQTPTPGALNGTGIDGVVDDTKFNFDRGFYDAPIDVTITTSTPDAEIYFTTDGSLPSPSSTSATLYSSPITISSTTNLRAIATRSGYASSNTDTQTYVFLDDILIQDPLNVNGNGASPDNGLVYAPTWQGGFAGDYEIDPRVVTAHDDSDPDNTDFGIRESLQSIPTISLTLEHNDIFGPNGINTDATKRGAAYRHPASIEFFDPATGEQFQYNVGLQAQGNASRDNARLLKHSFRVIFNRDFDGPGKLNFPLFDNSDFSDINTVSLKASFTDSFATRTQTNRYSPLDSTYLRDVFMRDTQLATGNLAPDSTYVHLYINGLYWGVYWPSERADDAFASSRLGGEREDWDIIRDFNELLTGQRTAYDQMIALSRQIVAGSASTANDLYQLIQGKNPDGTDDPNTAALLDVDNFIDYMALHLYGGVEDWPSHNWYAARNRVDPGEGFQFFTWDQEIAFDQLYRDRTENASNSNTPGELFQNLRNSSEFRLRFADRVHKHLFNDGAMTTAAMQARWDLRIAQVEPAIVGESARWGDAREGQNVTAYTSLGPFGDGHIPTGSQTIPLMGLTQWRESVGYIRDSYFMNAGELLVSRLTNDGLFTTLDAPLFQINGTNQFGGAILSGYELGMSAPGTVYYTLDGTDPRAVGGAVNGTVFSQPQTLTETTVVNARTFSGGQWSALSQATFIVSEDALVVSEINYNPYAPTAAELAINSAFDNDDFEFIELFNSSATTSINLLDVQLEGAVSFTFGATTLGPGERILVVEDTEAFETRYGTGLNVAGQWSGSLSNGGEELNLLDGLGEELMSVNFGDGDPWSFLADGEGSSLIFDSPETTEVAKRGKYYSWRASVEYGGTPGVAETSPAGVVINEILAHTDLPQRDAIELFNPTSSSVDVSGWYLSDSSSSPFKFQIPAGSVLAAGSYLVFDEDDFNPTPDSPGENDFALSSRGDEVYLTRDSGGVPAFEDAIEFGATFNGDSIGRLPNGIGRFARLATNSLGEINGFHKVSTLILSEVHYHPVDPTTSNPDISDNDIEFVEIHNPTGNAIDLENWRLRGEVDFDFAGTLAAGATLVVVAFDPTDSANAEQLSVFQSHYGVGSIPIVGGFTSNLGNSSGRVSLQQPDVTDPMAVEFVTVDEVVYDDLAPFANADSSGNSLNRITRGSYGNDAASWVAAMPTPGSVSFVAASVEGRHVFYNQSSFDGNSAAVNVDDDLALATDKFALLPGQTATFDNYTSFTRGLNGLFIDINNLADPTSLSIGDFSLATGNGSLLSDFNPSSANFAVSVRTGAGTNGSDRVTLSIENNEVNNIWLQVTVKANAITGLAEDDVFYFGNVIGETGNSTSNTIVNFVDLSRVRRNQTSSGESATITDRYDFNRNGQVNFADLSQARRNQTPSGSEILLITAPANENSLLAGGNGSGGAPSGPSIDSGVEFGLAAGSKLTYRAEVETERDAPAMPNDTRFSAKIWLGDTQPHVVRSVKSLKYLNDLPKIRQSVLDKTVAENFAAIDAFMANSSLESSTELKDAADNVRKQEVRAFARQLPSFAVNEATSLETKKQRKTQVGGTGAIDTGSETDIGKSHQFNEFSKKLTNMEDPDGCRLSHAQSTETDASEDESKLPAVLHGPLSPELFGE